MRLAIIGTVGLPARYGGFETLAENLVNYLHDKYDITVYCTSHVYKKGDRQTEHHGARLKYLPFQANGVQSILYDSVSIMDAVRYADILLVLGVPGAWVFPFVRLFTNKIIIASVDGIEWKREKWGLAAKLYLSWAEKMAIRYSQIDISDNESIQDYTAMRYGSVSRIVEYGADHTSPVYSLGKDEEKYPFLGKPYAIKICRIEPENNVHMVLDVFAKLPNHRLVIVGNWNHSKYGIQLREKYASCENIYLLDPVYEQKKLDRLRCGASYYVHGHSAGGTNPSLVEALFLGLPVIAYHVNYNMSTTEGKALYFTDAESLTTIIQQLEPNTLATQGLLMKEIAQRRYTWKKIAAKYESLIHEAKENKSKINVVPILSRLSEVELDQFNANHLKYQKLFFEKN